MRYAALTPEKRASFRDRLAENAISEARLPIVPIADRSAALPLTPDQERLWFAWRFEPRSAAYNVSGAVKLEGLLDAAAVHAALRELVARHEALRARFIEEDGVPRQRIAPEPLFAWTTHDASGSEDSASPSDVVRAAGEEPFDLFAGPLFRATLIRTAARAHVLHLAAHHIVCDGWSVGVLLREFVSLYRASVEARPAELPPLPIAYADCCVWQHEWTNRWARARAPVRARGPEGEYPRASIPADHPQGERAPYGGRFSTLVGTRDAQAVRALSQSRGATPFMTLLATWTALLSRLAGRRDVRVGIPVAGRGRPETHAIVGFFVKTLPLHVELDPHAAFEDWLALVRARMIEAQAHSEAPRSQGTEESSGERSGAPLFDVTFDMQGEDERTLDDLPGLSVSPVDLPPGPSKFFLSLHVTERAEDFLLTFEYAADRFEPSSIELIARHYLDLLRFCVKHPASPTIVAPLDCAAEWWGNGRSAGSDLLERVSARARERADEVALVHEQSRLSWSELWSWSGRLAAKLVELGVRREERVALCLPRSPELVASVLAVLRAGGAYTPLDPSLPPERLAWQVADCGARVVIAGERAPWTPASVRALSPHADGPELEDSVRRPLAAELAYVIYTSGTTGKPKGVAVSHGSLAAYAASLGERLPPDIGSAAYVSTPAADLGHTALFGALFHGWTLHVLGDELTSDPDRFASYLRAHAVDLLKIVPSHLDALLTAKDARGVVPRRCLVLGGETVPRALVRRIAKLTPACRILNHYGPTETTVGVLTHDVDAVADMPVVLGRPLAPARVYVLDSRGYPCPRGGAGEICVGGQSVARGYLGQPGLTAERFVPDPHGEPGARLYRTGDRARRVATGEVEFLGRYDDQIKIRGFRVEPGEVQAELAALPGVRSAAVIARPDSHGRLRLLAFAAGEGLLPAALRAALEARLPPHMVPSVRVVPALPLTPNGKVDRAALPDIEEDSAEREQVAPRNDRETVLLEVWKGALDRDDIGVTDDFFALGGESLLALRVVARARQAGVVFTVKDLFAHPRIDRLAALPLRSEPARAPLPSPTGEIPLTPIQARFFERYPWGPAHYNQSLLLEAKGDLDAGALEAALCWLVARHDALRLRFDQVDGRWHQSVAPNVAGAVLETLDLRDGGDSAARLEEACERLQRSLDLGRGLLLQAGYFRMPGTSARLLLVIHHLAVDGVSWRILLEELEAAYEQAARGEPIDERPAPTRWSLWATELDRYARKPELAGERAYWEAVVGPATAELPALERGSASDAGRGERVQRWDAVATRALLEEPARTYRMRVDELLLAALAHVLAEWTGRSSVVMELEGHGREEVLGAVDPSRTVGWFTARYPVRLRAEPSSVELLENTKETLRSVPNKGLGWGLLFQDRDGGSSEWRRLAQPEVSFNYLGRFERKLHDRGRFSISDEPGGDSIAPELEPVHALELVAVVVDGALSVSFRHRRSVLEDDAVAALAERFRAKVGELAAHCAAREPTPTASDFPLAALSQRDLKKLHVSPADLDDVYPATALQQGLLFHGLLAAGRGTYVNQRRVTFAASIQSDALRAAFQSAIERHDVLRTHFESTDDGRMLQVVHRAVAPPIIEHDLRGAGDYEAALAAFRSETCARGFDALAAPLFRVDLFARPDGATDLVWTYHHALLDGWSAARLLGELARDYAARVEGGVGSPQAPAPYRRFIEWYLGRPSSEAWWKERLLSRSAPAGVTEALGGARRTEPGVQELKYGVGSELDARLRAAARRYRVTLATLVQAAWAVTLARHSGNAEIAFGVTVSGRPAELAGSERMIGPFINSLPFWTRVSSRARAVEWLSELQRRSSELREYEQTPLSDVQRWAGRASEPLFDNLFVFENYPIDGELRSGKIATIHADAVDRTHYPLVLTVVPDEPELFVEWQWDGEKLARSRVERLARYYRDVLERLADADELLVGALGPVAPRATPVQAPRAGAQSTFRSALRRFEQRAREQPDADAVVCDGERLSYGELDAAANRLARALLFAGTRADERIGLCVARSPAMIAACLGVWKAGGAFVPLDPSDPRDRCKTIVASAGIRRVVADAETEELARDFGDLDVVRVDAGIAGGAPPAVAVHPEQLAYVIHTSGSTGTPKGVAVSHRALGVHIDDCIEAFALDAADRVYQFTPIQFDAALEQLFPALAAGGCVVMRGWDVPDAGVLEDVLRRDAVTVLDLPTAYFAQWVEDGPRDLPALRLTSVGGEAISPSVVQRWRAGALGHVRLLNAYGPTEATVTCVVHDTAEETDAGTVPIGRSLPSRHVELLGEDGEPVPACGAGEICVGGVALARGYLGLASATAESFVPDPHASGGRLYRTGDRARRDERGVLEFLGRKDDQIKLRGHRIELGHVQAALEGCPGVLRAAAVVRGAGEDRRLVAYVAGDVHEGDVRRHLASILPPYMVPSAFVVLASLPLTPGGKIDRAALPEPSIASKRVAPSTEIERTLLAIWEAVLGRSELGVTDDFFAVGGDSIQSLRIVARARAEGISFSLKQMFEHSTVAALAGVAKRTVSGRAREVEGELPLSPMQSWFFEEYPYGESHFNQSVLLRTHGPIDAVALERALDALYERHDALRLRFRRSGDSWTQSVARAFPSAVPLETVDLRAYGDWKPRLEAEGDRLQRSFDLGEGPLLRAALFRITDDEGRLLLVAHHLAVDAVSWRVLLEELEETYERLARGEAAEAQAIGTPWTAWIAALSRYAAADAVRAELGWWQSALAAAPELLPSLDPTMSVAGSTEDVEWRLDAASTRRLLDAAPRAYRMSVEEVLLTALARALTEGDTARGLLVDVEGHGRDELGTGADVSRTCGWFTTIFPVWLVAPSSDGEALRAVKERLRSVPHKGMHFGLLRYLLDAPARDELCALPRASVLFNYLGRFDDTLAAQSRFSFAYEPAGAQAAERIRASHALEVTALVERSELSVRFRYVAGAGLEGQIGAWRDRFEAALADLVRHCEAAVPVATASDFPLARLTQAELERIELTGASDVYAATPVQQGLLFHAVRDGGQGRYVDQLRFTLSGDVEPGALRASWQRVVARHDVLRTRFSWRHGGAPVQIVQREASLPFFEEDGSLTTDYETRLGAFLEEDLSRGFELERAPLMRVRLIRRPDGDYDLVWTSHHLLLDGWSTSRLLGEVLEAYRSPERARPPVAPFRDYVAWLLHRPSAESWWRSKIAKATEPAGLLGALRRPIAPFAGSHKRVQSVDGAVGARLVERAQRWRVTLNTLALGAWAVVLGCYADRRQVVLGATLSGRTAEISGIEEMLGLFIQSLPVWVDLPAAVPIVKWLERLQSENVDLEEHAHVPLQDVQRWAGRSGDALFDTLFVFENYPEHEALRASTNELGVSRVEKSDRTHYALTLTVRPEPALRVEWEWDGMRIGDDVARSLTRDYHRVLEQLASVTEETPLGALSLPPASGARAPREREFVPVLRRIGEQARSRQDSVGLRCEGEDATYGSLWAWSNRVGRALQRAGVRAESLVG
ncbi:MAG TPA: amino acid adenylation domain-containing protein, partial [Polyangiaceae bacterium]|nr:amino acid adenylation domain-containing protein [Polyangiaceae bacterium]